MSSTVSLRTSLLDSVGAGEHLQWMDGLLLRALVDRDVGELAVARDQLVLRLAHTLHERLGHPPRELDVLGAQPPGAVDRRAPLDHRDLGTGERHEVAALRADLLGAVVARGVPRDGPVSS